ncbi:hypothetical protein L210DRAFT_879140, partial [Boletus edulis BED1]
LDAWKNDQLEIADTLLTAAISESHSPSHHAFASRASVSARLQKWDAALQDAEMVLATLPSHATPLTSNYDKAIDVQPSIIAFLAKSIAHI